MDMASYNIVVISGFVIWVLLYIKQGIKLVESKKRIALLKNVLQRKIVCPACNTVYEITTIDIGKEEMVINKHDNNISH